jgi:SH3-like domain-containing protein
VKVISTFLFRSAAVALCLGSAIIFTGCGRGHERVLDIAYVSGAQINLRDHVAAVYEKTGVVTNGERVEVLDHDRRFAKVRTAAGTTGWIEQRFLASRQVFDRVEKLTAEHQNDPVQAQGTTRNDTNLHIEPGRDAEHLYQISSGEKLSLLQRGTAEKTGSFSSASRSASHSDRTGGKQKKNDPKKNEKKQPAPSAPVSSVPDPSAPVPVIEDWWLVRDSHNRVGWVLARMVDLDLPLEVAQYAEGQRVIAFFMLDQVQDKDKKVAEYLTAVTEPKDGLPFDFNQIRVFTWNVKFHRYETAYRERMKGVLPVIVAQEDFDKEGRLPVFTLRVQDENGNVSARKYKLKTPMVRRVYAPGEEPAHTSPKRAARNK